MEMCNERMDIRVTPSRKERALWLVNRISGVSSVSGLVRMMIDILYVSFKRQETKGGSLAYVDEDGTIHRFVNVGVGAANATVAIVDQDQFSPDHLI